MSDLFTTSEIALSTLGIAATRGDNLDIAVGGLGLGFTAKAALDDPRTSSLIVIEYLEVVIDWHKTGLIPLGKTLINDPRNRIVQGDFFALATSSDGLDPQKPHRKFDAILVDIDHEPDFLLSPNNKAFYETSGLTQLRSHLKQDGIFGLWSDALPDQKFVEHLQNIFDEAWAEIVTFHNPLQDREFSQTVYLARK